MLGGSSLLHAQGILPVMVRGLYRGPEKQAGPLLKGRGTEETLLKHRLSLDATLIL